MDISMNAAKGLEEEAGRHVNGTIEDHTIFFYGTCGKLLFCCRPVILKFFKSVLTDETSCDILISVIVIVIDFDY